MQSRDLLLDAFERVRQELHRAVDGLSTEQLEHRPTPEANSIAWLAWHLVRVQDDHVADVAGTEQVWRAGWADRFGLPFGASATGYGFSSAEVGQVRGVTAEQLLGYGAAVHGQTTEFLREVTDTGLDRVVDTRWDPPVTLGVRLVSVLSDGLQHAGQAAYARGLLPRRP